MVYKNKTSAKASCAHVGFYTENIGDGIVRVRCFLHGDARVHESNWYKKQDIGEGIVRTCCFLQGGPLGDPVCMNANGTKNKTLAKASCAHVVFYKEAACP